MAGGRIHVQGLREFQAALKAMDGESQKKLRVALNEAADLVATAARNRMPRQTGKARQSVKVASQQRVAAVKEGGTKAPYVPWLDWGGRVGPKKSVVRPFRREGRYLYPAFDAQRADILAALEASLVGLARDAGLDVA